MTTKQRVSSGSTWEDIVGYSRAVRVGPYVHVAGTTATDEAGHVVCVGDVVGQTWYILQKIERALKEAGGSFRDVVRTRVYVTQIHTWEQVAAVHREVFGDVRPATTLLEVSSLVLPEMALEIEVDAILENGEA